MKIRIHSICLWLLSYGILLLSLNNIQAQANYKQVLTVEEVGVGLQLSWSTSKAKDVDYFVVERAKSDQLFTSIGTVKNKQETGLNEYQFNDLELGLETVSYRLKEMNTDGSSSLTPVVTLRKNFIYSFEVVNKQKLSEEVFQVSINSIKEQEIKCRMTNNMGDIISEELRHLTVGLNDLVYDFSAEIDGTYNIIFSQKNVTEAILFKKEIKEKKGNVAKGGEENKGG